MNTKDRILTVARIVAGLIVWFLIYKLLDNAVDPYLTEHVPEVIRLVIESMVIPYAVGFPACYLIVRSMKTSGGTCPVIKPSAGTMAKAFLIQSGLSFPVMIPFSIIFKLLGRELPGMTAETILAQPVFYCFLLLVFAPVVEEILFRKVILTRLTCLGNVPAVIISAILFGVPHFFSQGPAQMFYTFVLGLVWGYIAIRTGKLWPSVLLHSLSNLYGGLLTLIWPKETPTGLMAFAAVYIIIMPTIAIILTVKNSEGIKEIKIDAF